MQFHCNYGAHTGELRDNYMANQNNYGVITGQLLGNYGVITRQLLVNYGAITVQLRYNYEVITKHLGDH